MLLSLPLLQTLTGLGQPLTAWPSQWPKNTTVLQQLTASNLALSLLVTTLTAANKKLVEALAKAKLTSPWLQHPELLGQCGPPTRLSPATTVGHMAINPASITQVQLAATNPQVTRMMGLPPTQWVAAMPTRVGTLAPDGVGWQM
jgi:hypothetical protein